MCIKIIKNNKDFFDQSLDEIKLLKYLNANDPNDEHCVLQLYDYFYFKVGSSGYLGAKLGFLHPVVPVFEGERP